MFVVKKRHSSEKIVYPLTLLEIMLLALLNAIDCGEIYYKNAIVEIDWVILWQQVNLEFPVARLI